MHPIKAAVLFETSKPLEIKTVYPRPLEIGQVLVKIHYSGVCRSQLMEVRGFRGQDKWLPHMLGHEASGTVIEMGDGVTKVAKGDEVILSWIKSEGLNANSAVYHCNDIEQEINSGLVTTFSNYSVVSENRIIKKPEGLSPKEAVLFGCALPTGAGMVLNEKGLTSDSITMVVGLGGIGLSAILALRSIGVENIIAIDVSPKKLELVSSWGVKNVFLGSSKSLDKDVNLIANQGVDFCFESAGRISTIEFSFSKLNSKGKLIFASHPPEGEKIKLDPHELISGKRIKGTWGGSVNPDQDLQKVFQNIKKTKIDLSSLLSDPYELTSINQALEDLELGEVTRPLIKMDH